MTIIHIFQSRKEHSRSISFNGIGIKLNKKDYVRFIVPHPNSGKLFNADELRNHCTNCPKIWQKQKKKKL